MIYPQRRISLRIGDMGLKHQEEGDAHEDRFLDRKTPNLLGELKGLACESGGSRTQSHIQDKERGLCKEKDVDFGREIEQMRN